MEQEPYNNEAHTVHNETRGRDNTVAYAAFLAVSEAYLNRGDEESGIDEIVQRRAYLKERQGSDVLAKAGLNVLSGVFPMNTGY